MGGLAIDIIAVGPVPSDPYEPAAPAWALGAGLRARGHSVRVLYPAGEHALPPPEGVGTASFPALPRHLGYAEGDAELARAARGQLRPDADVVVRDPLRPGPVGLGRGGGAPRLVALVRSVQLDAFDLDGGGSAPSGVRGKIARWRDRAGLRRLERSALREASAVCSESPELAERLEREYGIPATAVHTLSRPVRAPEPFPSREAGRRAVGVPLDDPVVVAVAPSADPADRGLALAREAFQRLRPIFPGARLVLAGAEVVGGNGITVRPGRDLASLASAIAAADIAVFERRVPSYDPGVALALGAGVPSIVSPAVRLPSDAEAAVRRIPPGDVGELSSALAELLADGGLRRRLADEARSHVGRFTPGLVAAELEETGALRAGPRP